MPNSKKKRTHKTSPNEKGRLNGALQERQAFNNSVTIREGGRTPWMIAKDKRRHLRILAGKPTQFMRRQAAKSNYKTSGPSAVPNSKLDFQTK